MNHIWTMNGNLWYIFMGMKIIIPHIWEILSEDHVNGDFSLKCFTIDSHYSDCFSINFRFLLGLGMTFGQCKGFAILYIWDCFIFIKGLGFIVETRQIYRWQTLHVNFRLWWLGPWGWSIDVGGWEWVQYLRCGGEVENMFFPTCQVRVVRFYVSCRSSSSPPSPPCLLPDLNHDHPRPVFAAGPQPRPSTPSVRCRTSTTTSHAQCSLPDLNHDQPRPVFAAGPQPRPATPSVRCRTSTTTSHAQCSLPDLNHDQPRPVFAAGPQPRPSTPSVRCRTSTARENAKRYAR